MFLNETTLRRGGNLECHFIDFENGDAPAFYSIYKFAVAHEYKLEFIIKINLKKTLIQ